MTDEPTCQEPADESIADAISHALAEAMFLMYDAEEAAQQAAKK